MNVHRFRVAAKLALPGVLVVLALPAFAEQVEFTTSGEFSACADASSCVFMTNGNSIDFSAVGYDHSGPIVAGTPLLKTVLSLGAESVAGTGGVTPSGTFSLVIDQTDPVNGTNSFVASLQGTVGIFGGNVGFDFGTTGTPSFTLGDVTYQLGLGLLPGSTTDYGVMLGSPSLPGVSPSLVNVTGVISVAPEPTFYTLTGLGFVGLFAMAIWRKKQITA